MASCLDRSNRICSVETVEKVTVQRLRKLILEKSRVESDFSMLAAPVPVYDETRFKVIADAKTVLIGIALFDSLSFLSHQREQNRGDEVEILFNLRNDKLGYTQFYFAPRKQAEGIAEESPHRDDERVQDVQVNSFNPYADAMTSHPHQLALKRYQWKEEVLSSCPITQTKIVWLFAWFAKKDLFEFSDSIGFNVIRNRPYIDEFSSWNYCSGNGSCDSTGMGLLRLKGTVGAQRKRPSSEKKVNARDLQFSVLYDTPMSMISGPLTPAMLKKQFSLWQELGFSRIHWLDYGDWPSFWFTDNHQWKGNAEKTFKSCKGNLFGAAVKAAHRAGLSLIGDLKTFDLGFNCFIEKSAENKGVVRDIDNRYICVCPEIADHQEWTMQTNPQWRQQTTFPVRRIRLFSLDPIPAIDPDDIEIYTSKDNVTYRRYRKAFGVAQGKLQRVNKRWTPAGLTSLAGKRRNWFVEISGLSLEDPYCSVKLKDTKECLLLQQGFMVAEVTDCDNQPAAFTVATKGNIENGFFFWKGWQGWNNTTEAILQERHFSLNHFGLVFREMPNMPSLLEPAYEGARRIWLNRIQSMLDNDADGVSIRTYCHHNGPMHYLKYAFAEPVVATFESMYGRKPRCDEQDYQRIREIRGDFYTEFMRAGKALAASEGKSFMFELESGAEITSEHNCRMQLPVQWERWIREGIVDEVRLKYFTSENRFIHDNVLPLCRKHDVPVQLISRCLHTGLGFRWREIWQTVTANAIRSGFSGYCFYEQQNLMDMTQDGHIILKGPLDDLGANVLIAP